MTIQLLPSRSSTPEPLLKVTEFAALIRMSPRFVTKHAEELGGQRFGRCWRFSMDRYREIVEQKRSTRTRSKTA